jgi:hypothetical protein
MELKKVGEFVSSSPCSEETFRMQCRKTILHANHERPVGNQMQKGRMNSTLDREIAAFRRPFHTGGKNGTHEAGEPVSSSPCSEETFRIQCRKIVLHSNQERWLGKQMERGNENPHWIVTAPPNGVQSTMG